MRTRSPLQTPRVVNTRATLETLNGTEREKQRGFAWEVNGFTCRQYLVLEALVAVLFSALGNRAVIYEGRLVPSSCLHMPIQRIIADVQLASRKPFEDQ